MKIEFKDLVKEFYEKNKESIGTYSFEKIHEICSFIFLCTKKFMEDGTLPNIRLQYFGNFLVRKKKIESENNKIKDNFDNKLIDAKTYFEYSKVLKTYLNGLQDNNN